MQNYILSKEEFVKIMEEVKSTYDYHIELNRFYKKHKVDGFIYQPDCSNTVVSLLETIFKSSGDSEVISYFCWELDFGRDWKENSMVDANGNSIKLQTSEDLYNYLVAIRREYI